MATEVTADDLALYLRMDEQSDFLRNIKNFIKTKNVMDIISRCTENEIRLAIEWCKKEKVLLVHKVFEKVEKVSSLTWVLHPDPSWDTVDPEQRTWLHVAVLHDRPPEILRFLVEEVGVNIESEDEYAYTPLHYYCQKEVYDRETVRLLLRNQDHLTKESKDGLTPLEFACSHPGNLALIETIPWVDMKYLMRAIDNVSKGVPEVATSCPVASFSPERVWLNLLQKNDKYMLLSYIKNDDANFFLRYYLEPADFLAVVRKCPENGQGITTYVKKRFFLAADGDEKVADPQLQKILSSLTGITVKETKKKRTFYKSSLFLALITGRFRLVVPLLRSCQFEIVPYAMLVCLVCQNLIKKCRLSDQVVRDVLEVKEFCEDFAVEVMYRTYNKDLSEDKAVQGAYISRRSDRLYGKSVLEIAYHAECRRYFSLPTCQESLDRVWTGRGCPRLKFWLHSTIHILFLALLAFVVVHNLFFRVSAAECLCYLYGVGYMLEEARQIFLSVRNDFFDTYCVDAANVVDLLALLFLLIGFLLRVCLPFPEFSVPEQDRLFLESKDGLLFILRLFLCLSMIAFFMRVLYFASVNSTLGPKLRMINTMIVENLVPLLFIFIIFMVSFGITFQALLYPNSFYTRPNVSGIPGTYVRKGIRDTISDIFRRAVFTIFDFHYTLNNVEDNPRRYITEVKVYYAVYFLLLLFMVVVNVMLMNLLIALFANTVNVIVADSKLSWESGRYGFIHEYKDRTIAPPPFNIVAIPLEILLHRLRTRRRNARTRRREARKRDDADADDLPLEQLPQERESDKDHSMSYYIYQAFALSGQRYRLIKDTNDLEYEKEEHFRTIEKKLKKNKKDLKMVFNDRCKTIEDKIDSLKPQTNLSSSTLP